MAGSSQKVILAALAGNSLIAISKFIAAGITGSSAMVSEGIHSVVDSGNQLLMLWGLRQARRPASAEFPFGHGKEIYFWGFVVAIMLFALGAGLSLYKGITHLDHPEPISEPMTNFIVLGVAIVFEAATCWVALREFAKVKGRYGYFQAVKLGKDPSMFVVVFEDIAALIGLLLALTGLTIGLITGDPVWDAVASIAIGLLLGVTAVWLAWETKGLLIGESANAEIVKGIRQIIQAEPGIDAINEISTLHMGPDFILTTLSIDFADRLQVGELENRIKALRETIRQRFPSVKRVFIAAESIEQLTRLSDTR